MKRQRENSKKIENITFPNLTQPLSTVDTSVYPPDPQSPRKSNGFSAQFKIFLFVRYDTCLIARCKLSRSQPLSSPVSVVVVVVVMVYTLCSLDSQCIPLILNS